MEKVKQRPKKEEEAAASGCNVVVTHLGREVSREGKKKEKRKKSCKHRKNEKGAGDKNGSRKKKGAPSRSAPWSACSMIFWKRQ